jgi:DNA repair protein RecO (recombination protein O)
VARPRALATSRSHTTLSLVLGRVAYGESDLVLTLFSEQLGRISAMARGARRSQRRFGGALEPMHTLRMRLDERPRVELFTLRESAIDKPRMRLVADLERMQAAGRALSWVRRAAPARTPEPLVWRVVESLLDRLDATGDETSPIAELGEAGLLLLGAFGWGIDFNRCVRCGKPCEPERPALLDPGRGGLVCRSCGGARLRLDGATRARLSQAAAGQSGVLVGREAELGLEIVEAALFAHAGLE